LFLFITGPFICKAASQESEGLVQETLKILLEGRGRYPPNQRRYDAALKRARSDTNLRAVLVDVLVKRLETRFESRFQKLDLEVDVLRKLDAEVALPLVKAWWDRPARISVHRLSEELQLHMMNAISEWLPAEEQVPFLKDAQADTLERPRLRLEAILLLCRNGSEEAINPVIADFVFDQREYDWSSMGRVEDAQLIVEPWDHDGDHMSDYIERGLLLDPTNPDTDGDSIIDKWDHNPLLRSKGTLTPEQVTARYLIYLHATYNVEHAGPFSFRTFILPETVYSGDKLVPNLLRSIEFVGVPAKFLHYTDKQNKAHHDLIGYGAHVLTLHLVKDLGPDRKEYALDDFFGDAGGVMYRIVVKRFDELWLPVEWKITELI
jgi:hypothetical protein